MIAYSVWTLLLKLFFVYFSLKLLLTCSYFSSGLSLAGVITFALYNIENKSESAAVAATNIISTCYFTHKQTTGTIIVV